MADSEKNQLVFVWLKVLGPRRLTAAANYNELHHKIGIIFAEHMGQISFITTAAIKYFLSCFSASKKAEKVFYCTQNLWFIN